MQTMEQNIQSKVLLVAFELYSSDLLNVRAKVLFDKRERSWNWDLVKEVYNFGMEHNIRFWLLDSFLKYSPLKKVLKMMDK